MGGVGRGMWESRERRCGRGRERDVGGVGRGMWEG